MTANQILLRNSSPAHKAALAFAHSFSRGNHKVLNLVGPASDGLALAKKVYSYMKEASADILFVTGEELRTALLTSVKAGQRALCRKFLSAKCLILVADGGELSAPSVQAEINRLLLRRYDFNRKTLVVTDRNLTDIGGLNYLSSVCHSVAM